MNALVRQRLLIDPKKATLMWCLLSKRCFCISGFFVKRCFAQWFLQISVMKSEKQGAK